MLIQRLSPWSTDLISPELPVPYLMTPNVAVMAGTVSRYNTESDLEDLLAVRQARLVDTESKPEEAPSEAEELQSLGSRVPLMGEEFVVVETSGTRTDSSHLSASLDSTAPLSPDHPLTRVSPTLTPTRASFHPRVREAMALSDLAFCKRYRSSYESQSSSSSLALPVRKRYRGTSELILDTDSEGEELRDKDTDEDREDESSDADDEGHGSNDEGHGLDDKGRSIENDRLGLEEEEEVVPEGQQQAVLVVDTATSEPLGLGYGAARHRTLESIEEIVHSTFEVDPKDDRVYTDILVYPPVAPVQTPLSPKWLSGSLPVSPSSPVVPSPIASPRLDALPPTLVADIDRDVRELYTRPMLALEAWAGHVDIRMADMSWEGYNDHRLIYDMLVQQAAMQRELQEMRGRIATLEHERGRREP
ncbi:hypothetical protein Tco_0060918 [Tanacetum coccineum]